MAPIFLHERIKLCEAKPYLDRNQDIVDGADILIAAPNEDKEIVRSGTWSTVRYARKSKKKIILVLRSGEVIEEGNPRQAEDSEDLGEPIDVGCKIICPQCGESHAVEAGAGPEGLLFYMCGENSYLVAIDGQITRPLKKEKEDGK